MSVSLFIFKDCLFYLFNTLVYRFNCIGDGIIVTVFSIINEL